MNIFEFPDILQNIARQSKRKCLKWMSFNKIAREIATRECCCRMRFTIETFDEYKRFPNVRPYFLFEDISDSVRDKIVQILNIPRRTVVTIPEREGRAEFLTVCIKRFIDDGGDILNVSSYIHTGNYSYLKIHKGVFGCSISLTSIGEILKPYSWEYFNGDSDVSGINSSEVVLSKHTINGSLSEKTTTVCVLGCVENIVETQPHVSTLKMAKIKEDKYHIINKFPNITELILVVYGFETYREWSKIINKFEKVRFTKKSVMILHGKKLTIEEAKNFFDLKQLPRGM